MDWQQLVSLGIVGTAVALLLRNQIRPRKFSFKRDTHCGCAAIRHGPPPPSVIFHARKGERPRVIVKAK